jgi:hypothetical protein
MGRDVLHNAVTVGTMSTEHEIDGQMHYQLGLEVNPGNSGGPILDQQGQVIGVLFSKAKEKGAIAFCVPVRAVRAALNHVQDQSPQNVQDEQSRHTQRVILVRYAMAGVCHFEICKLHILLQDRPELSKEAVPEVERLIALARIYGAGLADATSSLMSDASMPQVVRERLVRFIEICHEARHAAEDPTGTVGEYISRHESLMRDYELVGQTLKDLLGAKL